MAQNNNDFNKTTIRVEISDDDTQDITLDWSTSEEDKVKSIFDQMSIFTNVSKEKIKDIIMMWFQPEGNQRGAVLFNQECADSFKYYPSPRNMKLQDQLRDGDSFMINSKLSFDRNDKLRVSYYLIHKDFVHETECRQLFCHHKRSRSWLDALVSKINPDIQSYIENQPRPRRVHDTRGLVINAQDYFSAIAAAEKETFFDLNILQYISPRCGAVVRNGRRNYKPCRG